MSAFETDAPQYRLASTHYGDDLQTVASREMGDANRWVELIWLNDLVYPYITDDAGLVVPGVLLSGSIIKVPAPAGLFTDGAETGQVFERDAALYKKRLMVSDGGDLAVASGLDNLRQQLSHRVTTPRGQAFRHPDYGCSVWRLVGRSSGAAAALLGSEYVRSALLGDYRVSDVSLVKSSVEYDALKISATATAINGGNVDLQIDTSANAT